MSAAAVLVQRTAGVAFVDAVRAELSKIVTLPAVWLTIGGTAVLSAVLSLFFASQAGGGDQAMGSLDVALAALPYSQAGLFVLGVIVACSEHVGGQVRTTLIALPRRVAQRLAATLALALVAVPAALLAAAASILTTAAVLGDAATFPGVPVVIGTLVSATAYLTCMVVLSSALGSLTRRALPAAGALVLYLVVVSPMLLGQPVAFALPDIAGYTLLFTTAPEGAPAAPIAWLIVVAWTGALWAASTIAFRRRDV